MNKQIGKVSKKVMSLLGLDYKEELPIILGDTNVEHMKRQHPDCLLYTSPSPRD